MATKIAVGGRRPIPAANPTPTPTSASSTSGTDRARVGNRGRPHLPPPTRRPRHLR
jgi:hypothetical protein